MAAEFNVPLAEAIRALRVELVEAARQGQDEDVRFALGPVELELQVEMSNEVGAEAGVKFWLVSVGGSGSRTSATTHTVRLSLTPVSSRGEDLIIRSDVDERPE